MQWIEHKNKLVPVIKQCELLNVNRSRVYYLPKEISREEIDMMNEMRDIYVEHPYYGYRRIHNELLSRGHKLNRKKTQRLMQLAGIEALYQKKKTSISNKAHAIFPYRLKNLKIIYPNQVWETDITYVKIKGGFVYLTCIIDVFSRKILGWALSSYLDTQFCIDALRMALKEGTPRILNSDQGCQFTSSEWIKELQSNNILISMNGKGRCSDNIFIERFWKSIKYETIYLHSLESIAEAKILVANYIAFYNNKRPHQSLKYKTPDQVFSEEIKAVILLQTQNNSEQIVFCEQQPFSKTHLTRGGSMA